MPKLLRHHKKQQQKKKNNNKQSCVGHSCRFSLWFTLRKSTFPKLSPCSDPTGMVRVELENVFVFLFFVLHMSERRESRGKMEEPRNREIGDKERK